MARDRLEEIWIALTVARFAPGELRAEPIGTRLPSGQVLAALDEHGRRYLLVPIKDRTEVREDRRSAGVQIEVRELDGDSQTELFAAVVCLIPTLNDLFVTLAEDMLTALSGGPSSPGAALLTVLDRWRSLLERPDSQLLGPEQLAGLFAELQIVHDLTERNPANGLDAWSGPAHNAHDFTMGGTRLEVKATTVREGRMVQVHGVGQLAAPPGGALWLSFYRLEPTDDGVTVPRLIQAILDLGADARTLNQSLARAGYDGRQAEGYRGQGFRVIERRTYRVHEAFPRIVPASFADGEVPPGVLRLRYDIDLTGEPPVPLDDRGEAAVLDLLAEPR